MDIGWLKRISADSCKRASLEIYRSRSIYQFYRQITIASKLTNYILSGWDSKVAGLHAYLISLILLSFVFQVEKTSCSLLFMRKSWCLAALRCRETLSRLCGWSKLPLSKRPQLLQLLEIIRMSLFYTKLHCNAGWVVSNALATLRQNVVFLSISCRKFCQAKRQNLTKLRTRIQIFRPQSKYFLGYFGTGGKILP